MHESWKKFLKTEFEKPYFKKLSEFLHQAYQEKAIFPAKNLVFRAFQSDLSQIKVVILGQDPYHTVGVADGLAFSTNKNSNYIPPSLKNIFKEIASDIGETKHQNGDLTNWQRQGVFLLNNVLTVEAHQAGSHRQKGWEIFTETVVKYLNDHCDHLVFILWGRDARAKKMLINSQKHLIIESAHPSPLSAHNGFFGSKPFSKANDYLIKHGKSKIIW